MKMLRLHRFLWSSLGCFLILLLAACGSTQPPGTTGQTPTSGTAVVTPTTGGSGGNKAPTVTPGSTTAPMPPTQTSCPAAGTARAPVLAPLALGSHHNIVYIVNEFQGTSPTFGTLKRLDVTTGNKTEIVKLPAVSINDAQVSPDGQWIAFIEGASPGVQKFQLVRMDGQGLQTLYCGNILYNLQWSVDQKLLAFVNYQNSSSDIYLLNVQNGSLQRVFHPVNSGQHGINGYGIQTWLDATHLYLLTQPLDQPAITLSILDITRGTDQDSNALQQVFQLPTSQSGFCWNDDSSFDGKSLFINECTGGDPRGGIGPAGPSSILVQPATGGSQQTIFTSSTLAVTSVRVISKTTLLLIAGNGGTNADTSHNGLWKINTDGSGLTQLTSGGAGVSGGPSYLCQYTQYPWSNVSRDGSMYALQHYSGNGNHTTISLLFGSLNGGTPTTFASISGGTQLSIVGWTIL